MTIMIVDDSAVVRRALIALLTRFDGVEVIGFAETVTEATNDIVRLKPNVVVLDIQLRGGSGIDVLVNIKKELPAVLVIVLTAFSLPHLREQYRNAGADFFFDKTDEIEALAATVKKLAQHFPGWSRS